MRYGIERKTKLMTLDNKTLRSIRDYGNEALKAVGEKPEFLQTAYYHKSHHRTVLHR